jgi:mRNA-degrading endonuclease RelE of RelBE toxin-antitoxin system
MSQLPPWRVAWTPAALDDLVDLADPLVARIRRAVQRYAETRHGDVKKLKGENQRWRLRVSDWRVLFCFAPETHPDPHRVARNQPT